MIGGLFLIWKGVKELRYQGHTASSTRSVTTPTFGQVVVAIVGINLRSVDSILTVVGMTDMFLVMVDRW